jgi:hypothetical protein
MRNADVTMHTLLGMILMVGCGGTPSGTDANVTPGNGVDGESQATSNTAPSFELMEVPLCIVHQSLQQEMARSTSSVIRTRQIERSLSTLRHPQPPRANSSNPGSICFWSRGSTRDSRFFT